MTHRRHVLSLMFATAICATLQGCGGGDDAYFDVFQPRDATVADIDSKSFTFTDFQFGAVFDPSLSTSTTTLAFGASTTVGASYSLPFTLSAKGASSSGTGTLDGQTLTLSFQQISPVLPFTSAKPLQFRIRADVNDGRISLTNLETNVEQTSAPR